MRWWQAILECTIAEQEVDDIAFMWLQPVQRTRRNRSDIQPIDVPSVHKFRDPFVIIRDRCANESRTNLTQHLVLGTFHD